MSTLSGPAAGTTAQENLRGILSMLAAMLLFITNDMLVKLASEQLPTMQIIFLRGSMALVLVVAAAYATGALDRIPRSGGRMLGLRTIGEIGSTLFYLTALFHMPIANATAILQAMPIVMTLVSALFLGEIVRWRRWVAVVVGFLGMLLVVQPGTDGFDIYAVLAIISLGFAVLRDFCSRYLPAEMPSLFVSMVAMAAVTTVGGALMLMEPWQPVSLEAWIYLAAAAVFLSGAFFFIIEAMRHGEVSVVTPFRYSILLIAIAYGYLIWGNLPDLLATVGIVLIVGSGLYVFYRERQVHRAARRQPDADGRP
ncbi:S-adenosylmethionine uptake transporter [Tepidamorphus gemmatus]|uniref:S-adenosylmethionine uptake transporter n=1 Tax=Tepidamorphus gemmatus TaxID=747076 RepID=A0A4R3M6V7_9HYPH|nr:DMT family transporter [Tepidamorphus gemmatus]TCT08746.1 S-adenosylmethionine uptake transporter [Tepidamorphus gemmatus]